MLTTKQLRELESDVLDLQEQVLGITQLIGLSDELAVSTMTSPHNVAGFHAASGGADSKHQTEQLICIESVLELMDDGKYGYCVTCNQSIDFFDLKKTPMIEHCTVCSQSQCAQS